MRNPFLELLPEADSAVPGTFWATVTGTNPLRVQRDDEEVLPVTPKTVANLALGDRVLCLWDRRQVIVLGRLGGQIVSYPRPNIVEIDGTPYSLSGTATVTGLAWTGNANSIYYATRFQSIPFEPPSGWTFVWSALEATAWVFVTTTQRLPVGGSQEIRIIQINNAATDRLTRLSWQLVRA